MYNTGTSQRDKWNERGNKFNIEIRKIGIRENTMLGFIDNVKEVQMELSKTMNNLKRDTEAFNIKVDNIPGKLDANRAINNSKVEQCSNQINQPMRMIMVLPRKFNVLMGKVTNLEENLS
jgi:hypothetical protein